MIIHVTQEHINTGKANMEPGPNGGRTVSMAYGCPVALAMNSATGDKWCVGTAYAHVRNGDGSEHHKDYSLPIPARQFIDDFGLSLHDQRTLPPFEFELPI